MQRFYNESKEAALQAVKSSSQGLTQAEARARLERNGKNQLAQGKKDSLLKRFFLQMADPMILILLAAAAISGALAVYENESFTDVIIILFVVVVNAVLGVYQENKAEKAIEALQEMAAATSKVLRDGQMMTVRSEDLVVGDVVLLEAGDAVPADGRILESASLKIEEAALTGESVPVNKFVDLINLREGGRDVPLGDRKNMVYMGSTVVYGRGSAVITATGMDTEMGKIAGALAEAQEGQTPLQRKLSQLSKVLTWLVLGICLVIFGVQLLRAGSFSAVPSYLGPLQEKDGVQLHLSGRPGGVSHGDCSDGVPVARPVQGEPAQQTEQGEVLHPSRGVRNGAQAGANGLLSCLQLLLGDLSGLAGSQLPEDLLLGPLVVAGVNTGGHGEDALGSIDGRGRIIAQGQLLPHVEKQLAGQVPAKQGVQDHQCRKTGVPGGNACGETHR